MIVVTSGHNPGLGGAIPDMTASPFTSAVSKTAGRITEIAVLSPLRKGRVPGERRTYEERAVAAIANLAARTEQGLPTTLNLVPTIHFGRIMLLRPEQYLLDSVVKGVAYHPNPDQSSIDSTTGAGQVPMRIDDYQLIPRSQEQPSDQPVLRSFLLTTVEFDGDLKVYFRDIGIFMAAMFDLLFENCEEYPGTANFELFWLWIRRYQIDTQLFYSAYPNLTVARIKELEDFKRRFDDFVRRVRSPTGPRVRSMDELFDDFLRENQQIAFGFPTPGGTYAPDGKPEAIS